MALAIDTLVYARRLREAGFTEQQAEGQAEALAAAMTDSLATKQDLRELEVRVDARFAQVDARFAQVDARIDSLERHMDIRFTEQSAHFDAKLSDLSQQLTMRMMLAVGAVSALVKLL
jgi:hypothetical protein